MNDELPCVYFSTIFRTSAFRAGDKETAGSSVGLEDKPPPAGPLRSFGMVVEVVCTFVVIVLVTWGDRGSVASWHEPVQAM